MTGTRRTLFRAVIVGLFLLSGVMITVSPTRYKVDLDALITIWGDVFRDLDAVVKTVRISTELETEFGDAIADSFWITAGPKRDAVYVSHVGARVAAEARRQDIDWTFHVVEGSYPNAWAILGGHIYITTAMLNLIETEAELAAILGHEIAHVDLYHCVDLVQNRMILERVGLGSVGFVLSMAEDFLRAGYSEVQEDESDRYGMLLAAKAGYNPLRAFDTFRKFYLEENEEVSQVARTTGGPEGEILDSLGELLADYFASHPPFAHRLDALRFLLESNGTAWEGRTFQTGRESYDARRVDPGAAAGSDTWVFSERASDYLALRVELAHLLGRNREASDYFDRLAQAYPGDSRLDELRAMLSSRPAQGASAEPPRRGSRQAQTPSVEDVEDLWSRGRYAEAVALARSLLANDPGNPDVQSALSRALFELAFFEAENGQTEDAIAHYTEAIDLRDGTYAGALNNLAMLLAKSGQIDRALETIDRAIALENRSSLYRANRCSIQRRRGQIEDALESCERAFGVGLPRDRGNRAWVYVQRGIVRRLSDDMAGAVRDFRASLEFANPEVVRQIQTMMRGAGLYFGALDGSVDDDLLNAVEACVRSPQCFEPAVAQIDRLF